ERVSWGWRKRRSTAGAQAISRVPRPVRVRAAKDSYQFARQRRADTPLQLRRDESTRAASVAAARLRLREEINRRGTCESKANIQQPTTNILRRNHRNLVTHPGNQKQSVSLAATKWGRGPG